MKTSKVLIAYDGSKSADAALDDLRKAGIPDDADALVISVFESWLPPPTGFEILDSIDRSQEAPALAKQAAARISSLMPGWKVEAVAGYGEPAAAVIEKADAWRPDLIVVGSHGRNVAGRFFFGSVSQKLVHGAHCTVRVARGRVDEDDAAIRLVVGVDGSRGAQAAVDVVAARQWPKGSEARIINAAWKTPHPGSDQMLSQIAEWIEEENARVKEKVESAEKKLKDAGLSTSVVFKDVEPKQLLLDEAESWGADCIFVGARGMGRLERFLIGSVSSAVAARAHCSVEVVRTL
jgi:nucleotide-binding universal stress UspA family protein